MPAIRCGFVGNLPIVERADSVRWPGRLSPTSRRCYIYDWTATLNDAYQHDDKRQHKKKVDKAA